MFTCPFLVDFHEIRPGVYVTVVVCLSVCLLATLRKSFRTDLPEIFREGNGNDTVLF